MRLEKIKKVGNVTIDHIVYNDVYGCSELFEPKIWIDFWSHDKRFFLKTAAGEKIAVTRKELRCLNFKMTLEKIGTYGHSFYKRYMTVNSPRRASDRIPLLSISNKLNKIWRGCINVEREYENRWKNGYRYWCRKTRTND